MSFFRVSQEEVKTFFELIDGDNWFNGENGEDEEDEEDYDSINSSSGKCRDISKCLKNGQRIRHVIDKSIWIGIYDSNKNSIVHDENLFMGRSPLNQFAKTHYEKYRPDRTSNVNAWREYECEVDDEVWISTENLPSLLQ